MPAPTLKYWKVTGSNAAANADQVALLNVSGGPAATQLTSSPFDLGSIEAGLWSVPAVLLIEFAGSTAQLLDFKMYDIADNRDSPVTTSLGDDLFANYTNYSGSWSQCYNIHYDMKRYWIDPTTIGTAPGSSPIDSWGEVLYGGNPFRMDTSTRRPLPGNDATNNLLTANINGDTTRHMINFYLYLAMKPKSAATAGTHLGFGSRVSYIYP